MPKFDKRFVYFMWDDELQGKKCFVANSIGLLYEFVEINLKSYRYEIIGEGDGKAPFKINGPDNANMVFCYHDPWYDLKVAHEQGKTIQAHVYGYHQEYENCDCNEYKTFHSKIRKWGETEWVTPTREYMGLED